MYLLVCFDLSRETKDDRKKANQYRQRLLELNMKQWSLYERYISNTLRKEKVLDILKKELPDTGVITLYVLPDEVNDSQVTILGKEVTRRRTKEPELIFL
ncbi:CRISPR-associated endonuclease Cas2 [Staphylococcus pseudintermedius]|nr:CRISPR-associated endonuclease Cas2 [Staphylococcus pseudintermedius]